MPSKTPKCSKIGCTDYGAELRARIHRLYRLGNVVEVLVRLKVTIKLSLLSKGAITNLAVILLLGNVVGSISRICNDVGGFLDASYIVEGASSTLLSRSFGEAKI